MNQRRIDLLGDIDAFLKHVGFLREDDKQTAKDLCDRIKKEIFTIPANPKDINKTK